MRIDGLLVAGGRSRRFGADKRVALLGGRTLERIAIDKLRAAIDGELLIAGGGAAASVAATHVEDLMRGRGPMAGIAGGLARARFGVLVLPCDAPFVHIDTLHALARLGRRARRAVVLRSSRGWEPLVAFYPKAAFPVLAGALREGMLAPHRLLARLGALAVPAASVSETWNVNRKTDLEQARAWMARPGAATPAGLRS